MLLQIHFVKSGDSFQQFGNLLVKTAYHELGSSEIVQNLMRDFDLLESEVDQSIDLVLLKQEVRL